MMDLFPYIVFIRCPCQVFSCPVFQYFCYKNKQMINLYLTLTLFIQIQKYGIDKNKLNVRVIQLTIPVGDLGCGRSHTLYTYIQTKKCILLKKWW